MFRSMSGAQAASVFPEAVGAISSASDPSRMDIAAARWIGRRRPKRPKNGCHVSLSREAIAASASRCLSNIGRGAKGHVQPRCVTAYECPDLAALLNVKPVQLSKETGGYIRVERVGESVRSGVQLVD